MRLWALAAFCGIAFGQEAPAPPVLEFTGKPLVVALKCTDEDIQLAGLTCSEEEPCPVFLELSAVNSAGNRLFVAGNLHSAAVTMFSTLIGSEDGGKTWREAHDRIRGAGIDRIQFLDAETGWAAGERLQPLPQDPFLLVTTDGGKTWQHRPIFSESAENRLGAIQQFSFASRESGSLIVDRGAGSDSDRYELYESSDGGQSWGFKQSSVKPMTLRRPGAVSAEWRLRAESRTQAYHVEHRTGERWADVALFAVKAGVCKPASGGQ
jgi:photosystem II stability/assembly factor-like uncharacterized protein